MAAVAGRGESRLRALGRRALEEEAFRRTLQETEEGERAALDRQEAAFQRRMSGLAAKCASLLDPVVLPVLKGPEPRERQRHGNQPGRLAPPPPPAPLAMVDKPAPPTGKPASQALPKKERKDERAALWQSPPPPPAPRREDWDPWPDRREKMSPREDATQRDEQSRSAGPDAECPGEESASPRAPERVRGLPAPLSPEKHVEHALALRAVPRLPGLEPSTLSFWER